jgi:hypothetical protein
MAKKNKKAIARDLGTFLRLYPEIEHELRRLKPEELDRLIHGDDDHRLPTRISK